MELDEPVSRDDFISGRIYGKCGGMSQSKTQENKPVYSTAPTLTKQFALPSSKAPFRTPFAAPSAVKKQRVALEPVGLIASSKSNSKQSITKDQHWSAHWYVTSLQVDEPFSDSYFTQAETTRKKAQDLGWRWVCNAQRENVIYGHG